MRISSVQMKNYRQYRDLELTFKLHNDSDLHYVLAENGIGKTTLLNAINWCLYADEPHIGIKSKALPLINLSRFREMDPGTADDVAVNIEVEIQNGTVKFQRKWIVRKTEENKDYIVDKSWKAITCLSGECAKVFESEEADKLVNKFVPKRIRKFFFFDGEQMDTYFTDETGANVENSIFEISQIDLLNSMHSHLETIGTELRRTASNINPQINKKNQEYEKVKNEYNILQSTVEQLHGQLTIAKTELKVRQDELGDEPDLAETEQKREELSKDVERYSGQKRQAEDLLKVLIKKYTILLNTMPKLQKVYQLIKEKEQNKQLPPKIDRDELKKMLVGHKCFICDRDLDGKATLHIEELVTQYELNNEVATILTAIRGNIQNMIMQASKYHTDRQQVLDAIKLSEELYKKAVQEYNKIDAIIEKYTDKERIVRLHRERKQFEEQIKRLEKDIILGESDRDKKKNLSTQLKEELDKEFEKDKKHSTMIKEKELAENATEVVAKIISEIKDGVRVKISSEMNRIFFDLNWKKETFQDVQLSDSYIISLINVDGLECLGSCSAAERELLALSFTLALHKESGFDGPLVIDTPISRISGVLRDKFAKVLREVSKSKQTILYLTEDEYSTQVRDVFEPCASNKYELKLTNENYVEKRCK